MTINHKMAGKILRIATMVMTRSRVYDERYQWAKEVRDYIKKKLEKKGKGKE